MGATAIGSAVALPVIGIPLLGVLGFTSAGIAGGQCSTMDCLVIEIEMV
jgi:hypothetical protein